MTLPPYQRNGYGRFLIAFCESANVKAGIHVRRKLVVKVIRVRTASLLKKHMFRVVLYSQGGHSCLHYSIFGFSLVNLHASSNFFHTTRCSRSSCRSNARHPFDILRHDNSTRSSCLPYRASGLIGMFVCITTPLDRVGRILRITIPVQESFGPLKSDLILSSFRFQRMSSQGRKERLALRSARFRTLARWAAPTTPPSLHPNRDLSFWFMSDANRAIVLYPCMMF